MRSVHPFHAAQSSCVGVRSAAANTRYSAQPLSLEVSQCCHCGHCRMICAYCRTHGIAGSFTRTPLAHAQPLIIVLYSLVGATIRRSTTFSVIAQSFPPSLHRHPRPHHHPSTLQHDRTGHRTALLNSGQRAFPVARQAPLHTLINQPCISSMRTEVALATPTAGPYVLFAAHSHDRC